MADPSTVPGGVVKPRPAAPLRRSRCCSAGGPGAGLGKTTGWIHRAELKSRGVEMVGSVNYEQIGDKGLLISYGEKRENATWLDVDNIILCAGPGAAARIAGATGRRRHQGDTAWRRRRGVRTGRQARDQSGQPGRC